MGQVLGKMNRHFDCRCPGQPVGLRSLVLPDTSRVLHGCGQRTMESSWSLCCSHQHRRSMSASSRLHSQISMPACQASKVLHKVSADDPSLAFTLASVQIVLILDEGHIALSCGSYQASHNMTSCLSGVPILTTIL